MFEPIFLEFSIEAKFLEVVLFNCRIDELYLLIEPFKDCIWIFEDELYVFNEVIELVSWLTAVANLEMVVAFLAALTVSAFSVANLVFDSFKITVKSSTEQLVDGGVVNTVFSIFYVAYLKILKKNKKTMYWVFLLLLT